MNTTETRTERKEITLKQFLEEVQYKMFYIESPDIDVISVDMRGCSISFSIGELHFMNVTGSFAIEEDSVNGIYVDDGEFYIEFGDIFAITVTPMTEGNKNMYIKNLKKGSIRS